MPVYIDGYNAQYRGMVMCHMIADTPHELHTMAGLIGLQRAWFQTPPKASFWHYDVAAAKKRRAIGFGAVECDRNTFVAHLQRIRASGVFK